MINIPPKIYRPKPENKYIPLDYGTEIDDGVFDYAHYGKTVFRPSKRWADKERDDLIAFDEENDLAELMQNLKVGKTVSPIYKSKIISIIKQYWDCFCARGARRTILDYEFCIDTGASPPVCLSLIHI